jgi:hypothetical protein
MYAGDHHDGASMHQNVTYPVPRSSHQPEIMVPTLSLELFDKVPSQSSITLESSSNYDLDDITQHTKISRRHGKASTAHAVFKTSKLVSMERAQLARKRNADASSATAQSSSGQSSEVKIIPGSGTRRLLESLQNRMRKTIFDQSILPTVGSLCTTVDSSWQVVANGFDGKFCLKF